MPASSSSSTSCQRLGAASRARCVRQLVDQHQLGSACEDGVEIDLVERDAAVGHDLARDELEPLEQRLGLRAVRASRRRRPRRPRPRAPARAPPASIAYVLPTPGAAPTKIFRRLRCLARRLREERIGSRPPIGLFLTARARGPSVSPRRHRIQREVERQDVDPRLAEEAPADAPRCAARPAPATASGSSPRARATRGTWQRAAAGLDVRVEPAARRRHEVDGDRALVARVGRAQRVDPGLHLVHQRRIQRPEVRARGRGGVVGERRASPRAGPRSTSGRRTAGR